MPSANTKRRFINVNFTMSYEEYDVGSTMPAYHFHNDYEIYILESGERTVTVSSATALPSTTGHHFIELHTGAGDVVLFPREAPHKSRGTSAYSGICIHFSERFLKKYFTEISIATFMELFSTDKIHLSDEAVAEIKKMTHSFVPDAESNFLQLARIFELLYQAAQRNSLSHSPGADCISGHTAPCPPGIGDLFDRTAPCPPGTGDLFDRTAPCTPGTGDLFDHTAPYPPGTGHAPQLRPTKKAQLFTYINENYAYIHNLAELAETFEISESYLYKLFQNEYQMSPKTYINRLRIQNICNRLKYSDATIKSISEEFGFESYEHFCRLFKKEMGCSPNQYRKRLTP